MWWLQRVQWRFVRLPARQDVRLRIAQRGGEVHVRSQLHVLRHGRRREQRHVRGNDLHRDRRRRLQHRLLRGDVQRDLQRFVLRGVRGDVQLDVHGRHRIASRLPMNPSSIYV